MISHIHHINFIVRDLTSAVTRYQNSFGLGDFLFDTLQRRNVITARIQIGDTWLVLVQPTDDKGAPAEYLKQHGEGFFLMSLATDDLDAQLELFERTFKSNQSSSTARQGLENWRVSDLPGDAFFGAQLQLTQELSK